VAQKTNSDHRTPPESFLKNPLAPFLKNLFFPRLFTSKAMRTFSQSNAADRADARSLLLLSPR
jgi:hypothetical protein